MCIFSTFLFIPYQHGYLPVSYLMSLIIISLRPFPIFLMLMMHIYMHISIHMSGARRVEAESMESINGPPFFLFIKTRYNKSNGINTGNKEERIKFCKTG